MRVRVGVLTGGAAAPGLNAALCGLGRHLAAAGAEVIGFRDGWRGVIEDDPMPLDHEECRRLVTRGGTILGASSATPYREPERDVPRVREVVARHELTALVAIGGEGTLVAAERLYREAGLPLVGVPQTVDNDVTATDFSAGFFSAVERAAGALEDLRTTADALGQVLVAECLGRDSGWVAAYAGVAAAVEAICVPERPVHVEELCERLQAVRDAGGTAAIVAAAEGTRVLQAGRPLPTAGVGELLAGKIRDLLGWEARGLVLGPLQRAGRAAALDRVFALQLGDRAAELCLQRRFGRMAALQGGAVVDVPLAEAVATRKTLSDEFLDRYEGFFLPISVP